MTTLTLYRPPYTRHRYLCRLIARHYLVLASTDVLAPSAASAHTWWLLLLRPHYPALRLDYGTDWHLDVEIVETCVEVGEHDRRTIAEHILDDQVSRGR